jgi:NaMN:DMB phosphoribosyltransferase
MKQRPRRRCVRLRCRVRERDLVCPAMGIGNITAAAAVAAALFGGGGAR